MTVNKTPLTQDHTEKEDKIKYQVGELETENYIHIETETHSPSYKQMQVPQQLKMKQTPTTCQTETLRKSYSKEDLILRSTKVL